MKKLFFILICFMLNYAAVNAATIDVVTYEVDIGIEHEDIFYLDQDQLFIDVLVVPSYSAYATLTINEAINKVRVFRWEIIKRKATKKRVPVGEHIAMQYAPQLWPIKRLI